MKHLVYLFILFIAVVKIYSLTSPDTSLAGKIMEEADITMFERIYYNFSNFNNVMPFWFEHMFIILGVLYFVLYFFFYITLGDSLGDEIVDGTSLSIAVPSTLSLIIVGLLFYNLSSLKGDTKGINKRLAVASKVVMEKEYNEYIIKKVSLTDEKDLLALDSKMVAIEEKCHQVHCVSKTENKNDFKSEMFYANACNNGLAEGCYILARMFEKGKDIKQDASKAKIFYSKACDGGVAYGCEKYSMLNR